MTSQRSSEILRDWWRSQPNKFWPVVIIALVVIGDLIVVLAVIEYIAQRWPAGLFLEAPWFWILFGIVGLIGVGVVLLLLFWTVVLLWAWATLPFTLRAGVLAVDRLRLEVEHLRRQMFPAPIDVPGNDLDLDDEVES